MNARPHPARVWLTALGLLFPVADALAAPCPTRDSWPTTEWPSRVEEVAASKADAIRAMEAIAFDNPAYQTDGLLIIKGGAVVYERYGNGFDAQKRHLAWSVSKSISTALAGIAVHNGVLGVTDSVCQHATGVAEERCNITVKHLMEFGSGLQWAEEYEDGNLTASSVLAMLFGKGYADMLAFVLSQPFFSAPGETFNYSTGDATLLLSVVDRAARTALGADWMWTKLFEPIGMTSATVTRDAATNPVGGALMFATPRDFARFGYLYLNDGCWAGERLLPEDWVANSTRTSDTYTRATAPERESKPLDYPNGWSWWLNTPTSMTPSRIWEEGPHDMYTAIGHWGQYVMVVPSEDVVVVRTGNDRGEGLPILQVAAAALEVTR